MSDDVEASPRGRVAIFEWICGGGLPEAELEAHPGLLAEGQAMLECALRDALACGHAVELAVLTSLKSRLSPAWQDHPRVAVHGLDSGDEAHVLKLWKHIAGLAQASLVIAPELDNILVTVCESLRRDGLRLLNCGSELLQVCSDKLQSAAWFASAQVLHPPTCLLREATPTWLESTQRQWGNRLWVLKPRDGAGCEELRIVAEADPLLGELQQMGCGNSRGSRLVVQPWIAGPTFSQSVIVGGDGTWRWLPLMTQEFQRETLVVPSPTANTSRTPAKSLIYQGGLAVPGELPSSHLVLREQLRCLPFMEQARGWLSFDLVRAATDDAWYVIEANARCTTSMCEHQRQQHLGMFGDCFAKPIAVDEHC